LALDGDDYTPVAVGPRGLRLEVRHKKKNQRAVALYTRGAGTVLVPLPKGARAGVITISHGFEYHPAHLSFAVDGRGETRLFVRLQRWIDLPARGWYGADAHLHFDRLRAVDNADWLTILAAYGLALGHFLTLKGGNLPGLGARQYAHGVDGVAGTAQSGWIRPGTEYRDRMQGHVSLLGPDAQIEPVSTGGMGAPAVLENFPPLHDVMLHARDLGGLAGIAHGNVLGRYPTGLLDAILGVADFVEIANTNRVELELWYLLMNCGIVLPPAAGTDLPNHPFRDPWQPLLGETRMYVHAAQPPDFSSWKAAVRSRAVVVSSGPWLDLKVAGTGPGGTVHLPVGGGEVRVYALLESPRLLHALEIVHDGRAVQGRAELRIENDVHRMRLTRKLRIEHSGWVAARGYGTNKQALRQQTGIRQREMAHTAAVRVLVGEEPIRSTDSARHVIAELRRLQKVYERLGTYARPEDRA